MSDPTYLNTYWGEMAYSISEGNESHLLFLHGTGCDSLDWNLVIEKLPDNQAYITIDFRGHGQSSVPTKPFTLEDLANDVLLLINSIGIQNLILAGHSLGGMVAISVANRCPLIVGLVLLEGWTCLSSAGSAFDDGRFYGSLSDIKISEIQQKAIETRSRYKPDVWTSFWSSVIEYDGYNYLENASIPILEVFGEMGKNEHTEQKLRIPPNENIEIIWISNAGHYLPHECPAKVAEICIKLV